MEPYFSRVIFDEKIDIRLESDEMICKYYNSLYC